MQESYFRGFRKETVIFFIELRENNYKEWFEANREKFNLHVKEPFKALASDLKEAMLSIDPEFEIRPEKVMSRIYRDVRFSKNKSPYKTTMWLTYKKPNTDWQNYPAYFFEIGADSYRYGMGFYIAEKMTMDKLRDYITKNTGKFLKMWKEIEKSGELKIYGEMYKRKIPNTLSDELQDWYQRKNLYIMYEKGIGDELFSEKILKDVIRGFEILKPLYYFFLSLKD